MLLKYVASGEGIGGRPITSPMAFQGLSHAKRSVIISVPDDDATGSVGILSARSEWRQCRKGDVDARSGPTRQLLTWREVPSSLKPLITKGNGTLSEFRIVVSFSCDF